MSDLPSGHLPNEQLSFASIGESSEFPQIDISAIVENISKLPNDKLIRCYQRDKAKDIIVDLTCCQEVTARPEFSPPLKEIRQRDPTLVLGGSIPETSHLRTKNAVLEIQKIIQEKVNKLPSLHKNFTNNGKYKDRFSTEVSMTSWDRNNTEESSKSLSFFFVEEENLTRSDQIKKIESWISNNGDMTDNEAEFIEDLSNEDLSEFKKITKLLDTIDEYALPLVRIHQSLSFMESMAHAIVDREIDLKKFNHKSSKRTSIYLKEYALRYVKSLRCLIEISKESPFEIASSHEGISIKITPSSWINSYFLASMPFFPLCDSEFESYDKDGRFIRKMVYEIRFNGKDPDSKFTTIQSKAKFACSLDDSGKGPSDYQHWKETISEKNVGSDNWSMSYSKMIVFLSIHELILSDYPEDEFQSRLWEIISKKINYFVDICKECDKLNDNTKLKKFIMNDLPLAFHYFYDFSKNGPIKSSVTDNNKASIPYILGYLANEFHRASIVCRETPPLHAYLQINRHLRDADQVIKTDRKDIVKALTISFKNEDNHDFLVFPVTMKSSIKTISFDMKRSFVGRSHIPHVDVILGTSSVIENIIKERGSNGKDSKILDLFGHMKNEYDDNELRITIKLPTVPCDKRGISLPNIPIACSVLMSQVMKSIFEKIQNDSHQLISVNCFAIFNSDVQSNSPQDSFVRSMQKTFHYACSDGFRCITQGLNLQNTKAEEHKYPNIEHTFKNMSVFVTPSIYYQKEIQPIIDDLPKLGSIGIIVASGRTSDFISRHSNKDVILSPESGTTELITGDTYIAQRETKNDLQFIKISKSISFSSVHKTNKEHENNGKYVEDLSSSMGHLIEKIEATSHQHQFDAMKYIVVISYRNRQSRKNKDLKKNMVYDSQEFRDAMQKKFPGKHIVHVVMDRLMGISGDIYGSKNNSCSLVIDGDTSTERNSNYKLQPILTFATNGLVNGPEKRKRKVIIYTERCINKDPLDDHAKKLIADAIVGIHIMECEKAAKRQSGFLDPVLSPTIDPHHSCSIDTLCDAGELLMAGYKNPTNPLAKITISCIAVAKSLLNLRDSAHGS